MKTLSKMALVTCVGVMAVSTSAFARSTYPARIPNGTTFNCSACHTDPAGGGPRNGFGQAFQSEQLVAGGSWADLCGIDSDNDGQTNGFELGDPDCVWTQGATPSRTADISRPADAASTSAAEGEGEPAGEGEGEPAGEGEGEPAGEGEGEPAGEGEGEPAGEGEGEGAGEGEGEAPAPAADEGGCESNSTSTTLPLGALALVAVAGALVRRRR